MKLHHFTLLLAALAGFAAPVRAGVIFDDTFDDGNTGTGPSMTWNTTQTSGTVALTETGGELIWTTSGGTNNPNRGVVSDAVFPAPAPGQMWMLEVEYGLGQVTTGRSGSDLRMEAGFVSANAAAGTNRSIFFTGAGGMTSTLLADSAVSGTGFHTSLAMRAKNDTLGANVAEVAHSLTGNPWNALTQTGTTRLYMSRTEWALYANGQLSSRGPLSGLSLGMGAGEEFGNGFRVFLFCQSDSTARGVMRVRRVTLSCVPTASLSVPGLVEEDAPTAVSFAGFGVNAADEAAGYTFNGLFGDGDTLTAGPGAAGLQSLLHTWANPGLNLVTLTATQQHGIPSEPLQRPVLVTPAGFSGEIYRDDFDNGNALTNAQHGMFSSYPYSGVVPAITESGGQVTVSLTDASLGSSIGRALETVDVFPPPPADKAYVITWDVAPFTVTAQGSSLYDMGAELDVVSAREGNLNWKQGDNYRGLLECGMLYDGGAGAVNHTAVFSRRRGDSSERNLLHLGQAINPISGATGGTLQIELTRTTYRCRAGAVILSEGMLADAGLGFESGQCWDEGFRLRSMFYKPNTGGGTGSLNSLAVSFVNAASLNPPQEIVPLDSSAPGFLSATEYGAGVPGLRGEFWREAAATTPALVNAPITTRPGGLLDQRVFNTAPLGTFGATAINYSGIDNSAITTFLGTDGACYVGTHGTLDNGVIRLRGYLRITQPGTVLDFFGIRSDDGSYLSVGGLVIDNDGAHGEFTRARRMSFAHPGFYPVEARWFNSSNAGLTGGAGLRIGMATVAGTPSGILTASVNPTLPAGVSFVQGVEETSVVPPLVYEGFDMPAGLLAGTEGATSRGWGGKWVTYSLGAFSGEARAGSLTPPASSHAWYTMVPRGGHAHVLGSGFQHMSRPVCATMTGPVIYGSFLMLTDGPSGGGYFTVPVGSQGSLQSEGLFLQIAGFGSTSSWRIGNGLAGPGGDHQTGVLVGTNPDLFCFCIEWDVAGSNDRLRVWINANPATATPNVDSTAQDFSSAAVSGSVVLSSYLANGGQNFAFDEFRLGSTLGSVIGLPRLAATVTAPATAAAGSLQSITLSATHALLADQVAGCTWALNFGDGTTGTVSPLAASPHDVVHTWANAGTYTITATPTDRNGYTGPPATTSIEIIMPPLPVIARTGDPALTVNEGSGAANAGTFSDPQGNATVLVSATVGTVSQDSGAGTWAWSYTPADGPDGPVTVTVSAMDDSIPPNVATTTFTLEVMNVSPVAAGQTLTVLEDSGAAMITLAASDPGADTLAYSIVTPPAAVLGTLGEVSGNEVSFTPAANANGAASFTFTATDSDGAASAAATVTVNITPVNDAPLAAAQTVTTDEDTAAVITLAGSDVDVDALTYTVVASPLQGTLSGTAPNLTYTPAADFNGADTFSFKVNDGTADSNIAVVAITVTPVNDAPLAAAQTVTTDEDTAAVITLAGSDVDVDALTYTVVASPLQGTLSGTAPNLTYTPAADFNGADTFSFKVNDGTADSNIAVVAITVTPVNDAPTFTKGLDQARPPLTSSAQTVPGWASAISAGAADEAGQALTFTVTVTSGAELFTTPPALSSTGTLTFTPTGVSGTAVMSVTLSDDGGTANGGSDTSAAQTFSITIATAGPEIAVEQPAGSPLGGNAAAWGFNVQGQTDVPAGVTNFAQVSGGQYFTLALKSDGGVVAWGHNGYGQCDVPPALSGVVAVSAGARHSMTLKSDGTVVAWGYNTNGQADVPVGLANVIAIAAGGNHCMALKADGTVAVWGSNAHSQREVPPSLSAVTKIASYGDHCLALKVDGTVAAWGNGISGQSNVPAGLTGVTSIACGYGHCLAAKSDGTVVAWGLNDFLQTTVPPTLTGVIAVASGGWHSLALKSDGTVVGWGYNPSGQATPPTLTGVSAIAAGEYHSLAIHGLSVDFGAHLTTSSAVRTFTIRSTGTGPLALSSASVTGGNVADFTVSAAGIPGSIAAGGTQTFTVTFAPSAVGPRSTTLRVVSDDADEGTFDILLTGAGLPVPEIEIEQPSGLTLGGVVEAWGHNVLGQTDVPNALSNVIAISGGQYFTLALKNDGSVIGWGQHEHGQITIPVSAQSGVTAISAGARHSMALKSDGTVKAWGFNTNSQCDVPGNLLPVIAIAAGGHHCLALQNDGTVRAWGSISHSQTSVPVGLADVVAIAAHGDNSMALKSDGTVVCWGGNNQGQADVPAGLNGVVAIANGYGHSVALKADGTVVTWGATDYDQDDVPAGLADVVAIACGGWHTVALKSDGTVEAWGYDASGQASEQAGLSGVTAIAAGEYHTLAVRGQAVDFGTLALSVTSAAQSFTIRNSGAAPLAVSSVSVTGGNAADFTVTAAGLPASVAPGDGLAFTVTFTPSATGPRSTTLRIASDDADEGTLDIALTGFGGTPLQSWREQNFGTTANAGTAANDADPDNDGIPNVVEHALLGDPHSDSQSGLPAGQAETYAEGDRLTLRFDRSAERSDITIFVEANDTLDGTWTELACSVHGAPFTGPGTVSETVLVPGTTLRRVTVRDVVNVDDAPRRFTRVRVVED